MAEGEKVAIICVRCQRELEPAKMHLSYLGHDFAVELLKCPGCGEVYIPEELVRGRIAETEMILEDK